MFWIRATIPIAAFILPLSLALEATAVNKEIHTLPQSVHPNLIVDQEIDTNNIYHISRHLPRRRHHRRRHQYRQQRHYRRIRHRPRYHKCYQRCHNRVRTGRLPQTRPAYRHGVNFPTKPIQYRQRYRRQH